MKKKILSVFCAGLFLLGSAACGDGSGGQSDASVRPTGTVEEPEQHFQDRNLHRISVTPSSRAFINNGKSDYVIVAEAGTHSEKAANYIAQCLEEASGVRLPVRVGSDGLSWSENSKWIVVGCRDLFEAAGLSVPEEDIGLTGYYIKTAGDSVFIEAGGVLAFQGGALAFLHHSVGYEMYAADTVVYENAGETLPDMDIVEKPDFDFNAPSNSLSDEGIYGMGYMVTPDVFVKVGENYWHNSFDFLDPGDKTNDPDWFNENRQQLCYTAKGDADKMEAMLDKVMVKMIESIEAAPDAGVVTFTVQDGDQQCHCKTCLAEREKYGSYSGVVVKFVNRLADRVDKYLEEKAAEEGTEKRDLTIIFFAYYSTFKPPVKLENGKYVPIDDDVVCRDNVGVFMAPIDIDYTRSIYDSANDTIREGIDGWSALTDKMYIWLYDTNFYNYLYPFNSFDSRVETLRYFNSLGARYGYSCGQHDHMSSDAHKTGFTHFKDYLNIKTYYNVNLNYDEVTDDWFDNYFAAASEPMRKMFDEIQLWMRTMQYEYPVEFGSGIYANISQQKFWPKRVLDRWLGYIDDAYAAAEQYRDTDPELYDRVRQHIRIESVFPKFALATLHAGKFSDEELLRLRMEVKVDCEELNIRKVQEHIEITTVFSEWGL